MSTAPVAIVTGASQGIGKAIATELAERGYRLSLMSRSDGCVRVAESLGGIALRGSVTEPAYIDALVEHTLYHYGRSMRWSTTAGVIHRFSSTVWAA